MRSVRDRRGTESGRGRSRLSNPPEYTTLRVFDLEHLPTDTKIRLLGTKKHPGRLFVLTAGFAMGNRRWVRVDETPVSHRTLLQEADIKQRLYHNGWHWSRPYYGYVRRHLLTHAQMAKQRIAEIILPKE